MIFSFQYKEEGRVNKLDDLLLQDSASKIQRRSGVKPLKGKRRIGALTAA